MRDSHAREATTGLKGMIDVDAVIAAWEATLQAPQWDRAPVWFHGDLAGNLLFVEGRLSAIIDLGR